MKEPILSREEVLAFASDAFGIDYDRLDARFEKYASLIEAAVLERVCREPIPYGYEFLDLAGVNHFVRGSLPAYAQSEIVPLYTLKDRQS